MPRTKEAFDAMRENTKHKIETAALSLFARKGLSVKIGEIAKSANLSQGLLYSHYSSKDELIAELVRQAVCNSSNRMMDLAESDLLAVAKIQRITSMMCRMFSEEHKGIDYFMFMVQVGMSGFQATETPILQSPTECLAQIIKQGQAEGTVTQGDPTELAMVYWSAIQGLCCYVITGTTVMPNEKTLNRILLKRGAVNDSD